MQRWGWSHSSVAESVDCSRGCGPLDLWRHLSLWGHDTHTMRHMNSRRHAHNASNILPLQHGGGVGTGNAVTLPGGVLMWSDWGIKGDGSVCSQLFSSVDRKDDLHSSECRRITHNAWRKSTLLGPTEAVCTQVVQKHVETFVWKDQLHNSSVSVSFSCLIGHQGNQKLTFLFIILPLFGRICHLYRAYK